MATSKADRFRQPYLSLVAARKIGEADCWAGAFALAQELERSGPLRLLTISTPEHPRFEDERCMELTAKGTPSETIAWLSEFTPLVHDAAKRVELYLSEGQMMHLCGPYDAWRLDLVFTK